MPSAKPPRSRKGRAASRSPLSLECLESRLALNGAPVSNVNAQLFGSTLLLTGDMLGNSLVVATSAGGKMAVIGTSGTMINGVDTSVTPFVTSRAVTNIVATLNGGNDFIGFGNNAAGLVRQLGVAGISPPPFNEVDLQTAIDSVAGAASFYSLPGSLTVTTGAGDDAVGILGLVGRSVAVNLGSALSSQGNAFAIGEPLFAAISSRIEGSLSVVGGAGNDRIFFTGTDVGAGVAAALGDGVNETFMKGTDTTTGATIGSFAYSGGAGSEEIALGGKLTVRNDVSVFTGPRGADRVGVFGGVNVGGGVTVNTGAGGGDDSVRLMPASITRGLSVTTGAGNDEIEVQWSDIGHGVVINSGAGNDRLELTNVRALAALLYGGTGTNTLTTNAATRSGVRTLRYYQFQTVNNLG